MSGARQEDGEESDGSEADTVIIERAVTEWLEIGEGEGEGPGNKGMGKGGKQGKFGSTWYPSPDGRAWLIRDWPCWADSFLKGKGKGKDGKGHGKKGKGMGEEDRVIEMA